MSRVFNVLLLTVALLLPAAAIAHPDIAITARVMFDVRESRLVAVAQQWTFDADYGRRLITQFDADDNGGFDDAEIRALGRRLETDLAPFGYLAELAREGAVHDLGTPEAFDALITDGIVVVTLGFVLNDPIALTRENPVDLTTRDPDYTAAMRFAAEQPVILRSDNSLDCETRVLDRADRRYFGGLVMPQAAALICR